MSQLELSIKPPMQEVDPALVSRQGSFTNALVLAQTLSGLEDKELCGRGGIINDTATWSRIKGGSNNFPQDNLCKFMDAVGNEAPLIWLAQRRGYELVPLETEMERRLRVERERSEKLAQENALLRSLMVGRAT